MESYIDCSNLKPIGKGVTAVTYILDEDKVIKAYKKGISLELIEAERRVSEVICAYGVRTPVCYETVRTEEWYGNVYQAMRGGTFTSKLMSADSDGMREWMVKYAGLAKSLHGVCAGDDIDDVKEYLGKHLELSRNVLTDEAYSFIKKTLECFPKTSNLLHGDMSSGNIMIDDGELYFIDLATVAKGHPVYDLTVPYMVTNMWPKFAKMANGMTEAEREAEPDWFNYLNRYTEKALSEEMGIIAWRCFIKEYFSLSSEEDEFIERVTELIHFISMTKYSMSGSFISIYPEVLVRKMADFYSSELYSCREADLELLKDVRWNIQKAE
ncbi:MAG: phosphotransferase [Eubacteriales bacterium]|nr:phosphotransferase [Eubacteriales bacterium]